MRREELEHVIRVAAAVSVEADVFPRDRPERATDIDGAIGEGSILRATIGQVGR